jgi:hypothetical protein
MRGLKHGATSDNYLSTPFTRFPLSDCRNVVGVMNCRASAAVYHNQHADRHISCRGMVAMEFKGTYQTILSRGVGRLVVSNLGIEVYSLWNVASLRKEEVLRIELVSGKWPSIKIRNNHEPYPHIEFWCSKLSDLVRDLEFYGYPVETNPTNS